MHAAFVEEQVFRIDHFLGKKPAQNVLAFRKDSGVGLLGPDHLIFDLADSSKTSLSFHGGRPRSGMRLDQHSLQFAMNETRHIGDVLEACERLWEVSTPLLDSPPPVSPYAPGVCRSSAAGATRSDSRGPSVEREFAPHRLPRTLD